MRDVSIPSYSKKHERANVITHLVATLLTLALSPFLIARASDLTTNYPLVGILVFSIFTLITFVASTIYHATKTEGIKRRFQTIDYLSIFLLITGSYTAFFCAFLYTSDLMWFLFLHWGLSILGITLHLIFKKEELSLFFFLLLGLLVVFKFNAITSYFNPACYSWLLIGGASYLIGVVFYVLEKVPFNHAIWHLWVMGGSASHGISLWEGMG